MKCLIIGSGPAGYTAAIYAGRANLSPVEYCGPQTGGQLTQTTIVENFPGYPEGVDANQMMMELRQQANASEPTYAMAKSSRPTSHNVPTPSRPIAATPCRPTASS